MNLKSRLEAVEQQVGKERRRQQMASCKDMEWGALCCRVEEAIDDADVSILERIVGYCDEVSQMPSTEYRGQPLGEPPRDEEGNIIYQTHFFERYLCCLRRGSFSLPDKLPRGFLESFDRLHGDVSFRCADCRCGFGNAVLIERCAVCGGELEHRSLGSWAPFWESEDEFKQRRQADGGKDIYEPGDNKRSPEL